MVTRNFDAFITMGKDSEAGFTLIELLVVVAIIGILAAIAIPQFTAYKTRSLNSRAMADLRNAISAQEAYYVSNDIYASCSFNTTTCDSVLPGFKESEGVLTFFLEASAMTVVPTSGGAFAGVACHTNGNYMYEYSTDALSGVNISTNGIGGHTITDCTTSISALP